MPPARREESGDEETSDGESPFWRHEFGPQYDEPSVLIDSALVDQRLMLTVWSRSFHQHSHIWAWREDQGFLYGELHSGTDVFGPYSYKCNGVGHQSECLGYYEQVTWGRVFYVKHELQTL